MRQHGTGPGGNGPAPFHLVHDELVAGYVSSMIRRITKTQEKKEIGKLQKKTENKIKQIEKTKKRRIE